MKKILVTLMIICLSFTLTGCGSIFDLFDFIPFSGSDNDEIAYYTIVSIEDDGDVITLEKLHVLGFDHSFYLVLEPGGTGYLVLFDEEVEIQWDNKARTIINPDEPGEVISYNISGDKITLDVDGAIMIFELCENVPPLRGSRAGLEPETQDEPEVLINDTDENTISPQGGEIRVSVESNFLFTPSKSGFWAIYTADHDDCDPTLRLFSSDGMFIMQDDDSAGDLNAFMAVYLEANTTYIIKAEYYQAIKGGYTLVVEPLESISSGGESIRVRNAAAYEFTPNETRYWAISTSNNGDSDPIIIILDADGYQIAYDDDSGGDYNAYVIVELNAANTYIIQVKFYGYSTECILEVSHAPENEVITTSGSSEVLRINGRTHIEFAPDKTGAWVFITSDNGGCDPYLEIYDEQGNLMTSDDDTASDRDALMVAYLEEGNRYTVIAGFYSGTGRYTLTINAPVELSSNGDQVRVEGTIAYMFTPGRSGTWEISTSDSGHYDPFLVLVELDTDYPDMYYYLADDDDSAGGYDALISYNLQEGITYVIIATCYTGSGNYTLNVERK